VQNRNARRLQRGEDVTPSGDRVLVSDVSRFLQLTPRGIVPRGCNKVGWLLSLSLLVSSTHTAKWRRVCGGCTICLDFCGPECGGGDCRPAIGGWVGLFWVAPNGATRISRRPPSNWISIQHPSFFWLLATIRVGYWDFLPEWPKKTFARVENQPCWNEIKFLLQEIQYEHDWNELNWLCCYSYVVVLDALKKLRYSNKKAGFILSCKATFLAVK
jgi:hypothetical protein